MHGRRRMDHWPHLYRLWSSLERRNYYVSVRFEFVRLFLFRRNLRHGHLRTPFELSCISIFETFYIPSTFSLPTAAFPLPYITILGKFSFSFNLLTLPVILTLFSYHF